MTAPARSFRWDYREQPPLNEIADTIRELSGGTISMSYPDDGSDEYQLDITLTGLPAPLDVAGTAEWLHAHALHLDEMAGRARRYRDKLRGEA